MKPYISEIEVFLPPRKVSSEEIEQLVNRNGKFVPAGSVRVLSNNSGSLHSAAFVTPTGKNVLIVLNDANTAASFNIQFKGKKVVTHLPVGGVGSYTW